MSMPRPRRRVAATLLALVAAVIAVTALTVRHAQAAAPANTQVALLPAPSCPDPGSESAPWRDPKWGPDCQAQYVIDDLENANSSLYATTSQGPAQSTLQRLEAAIATGTNIEAADGSSTSLLSLYGLTVSGGGDDGADGERATGLAFPNALTVGASWDPSAAQAYGQMLGSEFHRTGLSDVLGPVIDIDRTWHTGRENENFGEDPFLTGSLVAPEVRAIQSQGVMTTVKHCCAYTQEQGRAGLALSLASTPQINTGTNQLISERALEEIYGPAWQAAVSPGQGDAMSVMCGYAIIDGATPPPYTGADSCGNRFILGDLIKGQYGFQGTFTPDAVTAKRDTDVLNFENGGDGGDVSVTLAQLRAIVGDGSGNGATNPDGSQNIISQARLVDEVRRATLQSVKNERFLKPPTQAGVADGVAQDETTSASIEEQGSVLLKNSGQALPLSPGTRSIAVIGTQAGPNADTSVGPASAEQPQIENDGSPFVDPTNSYTDTTTGQTFGYQSALGGVRAQAGSHTPVSYSPGSVGLAEQPALQATGATSGPGAIATPDGSQPGFLATYFGGDDPTDPAAPVLGTQTVPSIHYNGTGGPTGPTSIPAVPNGSPAVTIPAQYQDNQWSVSYRGTYVPTNTGDYNFSVAESGTTKLYVSGRLVEQRLRDDFGYVDHSTVALHAGRPVSIVLNYSPMAAAASNNSSNNFANFDTFLGDEVHLGAVTPTTGQASAIDQAVRQARSSDVAVVFAGREIGEGHDIESLDLPGDENELIDAVASANRNTVVVLTGGPVAMPWLHKVSAVLEMWEPGATFGTAVGSLLFGQSNPSGKLPITFPASPQQGSSPSAADYPGITDLKTGASDDYDQLEQENYDEGVDVGYRYYQTHHESPLFPFGYGLSYTRFRQRISATSLDRQGDVTVQVADTNLGRVAGADVVEGYVRDPAQTGEPPEQLRAFAKVQLAPGQTRQVTLSFRPSSFAYWASGAATGTQPETTSPSTPGPHSDSQPAGGWRIARGDYRVDIGDSSASLADSVRLRLTGHVPGGSLDGLFGWTLPAR
jgi:beta-glucosidase